MGIDFGFTVESRIDNKYARCRRQLGNVVAIWDDPASHEEDPYAGGRLQERVLNARRLREEQPDLYDQIQNRRWPRDDADYWYWSPAWVGDAYQDKDLRRGVKPYMELRPSGVVLLSKLEPELAVKAIEDAAPDRQITAWDKLGYERRMSVCKECPVRPLDEPTCYLRFGNYPGMDAFRMGFLLTTEYAFKIDDEQLTASPFSFEHLDRQNGELPRDKFVQLMEGLEDVEINKRPEEMANQVFQTLALAAGPGEEVQGAATDLAYMPFVDEFVSRYLYRDEPYSAQDARELLPYLETIAEANDWAIWDADEPGRRRPLIVFRNRMRSMIEGLKTAEKYGLEMYVSY